MKKLLGNTTFFLVLVFIMPSPALAHKVNVFAMVEGNRVHVDGYFADGRRCMNCRVMVTDADSGKTLVEGVTDDEGSFSFPLPHASSLKIFLDAGSGHAGQYFLGGEELHPGAEESAVLVANKDAPETGSSSPEGMEALLDRKLAPVQKELRRLREAVERPGMTEILGGIGYIIGLMGLAAYYRYRKNR